MTKIESVSGIPQLNPQAQLVEHSNFIPFGAGDQMPMIEGPGHREAVKQLASAVIREANYNHDLSVSRELNEDLQESLYVDALTGVPNNEAFNLKLADAIKKADSGEGEQPTVFFIDLDNFKKANDTLGHDVGDELLIKIANALQEVITVRDKDGEAMARKSGDEFLAMIFAKNLGNDLRDVTKTPEEIINGVKERWDNEVRKIAEEIGAPFVAVSIGVATRKSGEGLTRLRTRADIDMYRAKKQKHGDTASSR